ncbi:phage portal protein [Dialister hominis]|uniref:Portal protein n=1 Tax=Dialister hominis TaxID=2582419 RepID=A0A8D4UTJ7_9FIRM|nr:phage portal protein [Dialister hominis]BBK24439.1 hypothetical protein Dia5BBH33_03740 [Dialister hominis]
MRKIQLRSMIRNIFGRITGGQDGLTRAKLLNGWSNDYVPFDGEAYDNATGRNCIDTIARHAGKLHPRHIVRKNGNIVKNADSKLQYLLSTRPNWLMPASEFIEKIVAQYYCYNNLFVYIQRDMNGNVEALWPLNFNNLELFEDKKGNLYCRFTFGTGEQATVPYEEMIHIRRHFNRDDVFGDPEGKILREDINLLKAVKTAVINVVKNFHKLRGIIQWTGTVRPEDQESMWRKFVDSFAGPSNGSGIGSLDNRGKFQQLTTDTQTFESGQMKFARDNLYKYFGVSEEIVSGKFKEEEYQAFYESVIAPIAIKLSQEFTEKIFTPKERGFGNEIVFEGNRLAYMSTTSKVKIAEAMIPAGAIKRNEIRELFGYAGLPGKEGEGIVVSLNYVKSKDQSLYQTGKDDDLKGGDGDEKED